MFTPHGLTRAHRASTTERDKVACRPILDGRVLEEAAGENSGDRSVVKNREMNLTLKS